MFSATQDFSAHPIAFENASRFCGVDSKVVGTVLPYIKGEKGDIMNFFHLMRSAMKPGPNLESMSRTMLTSVLDLTQSLSGSEVPQIIELQACVRHYITIATTNSVYGPSNPFHSSEVESNFWSALACHFEWTL